MGEFKLCFLLGKGNVPELHTILPMTAAPLRSCFNSSPGTDSAPRVAEASLHFRAGQLRISPPGQAG